MKRVLLLTGIPGAGKSTVAGILAKRLNRTLVTTHELVLRVDPESLGRGDMADGKAMRRAFVLAMDEHATDELVVDGWPRTIDQAQLLPDDSAVVLLVCPPHIARDRLLRRGRSDDTEELIDKRITEQAGLLGLTSKEGWAYTLAGWEATINTHHNDPVSIAGAIVKWVTGKKTEAHP